MYLRRDLVYPGYVQLAVQLPLVQEVNSDELAELKLYSRTQYLYHLTTRNLLDRRTKGWVFVTRELCAVHPYFSRLPGRKIVIANGIDLERFPHLPLRSTAADTCLFGPPRSLARRGQNPEAGPDVPGMALSPHRCC